jgi:hypothetical protein
MEARHRIPIGDSRPHTQSPLCACGPECIEGDEYDLVLHHAFDGREIIIQAEIVMGIRCKDCLEYLDSNGEHTEEAPPTYDETSGGPNTASIS